MGLGGAARAAGSGERPEGPSYPCRLSPHSRRRRPPEHPCASPLQCCPLAPRGRPQPTALTRRKWRVPGAAPRRGSRAAALEPDQSGIERAEAGGGVGVGGGCGAGPHLTAPSGPAPIRPRPAPGALRQSTRAGGHVGKGYGTCHLGKVAISLSFPALIHSPYLHGAPSACPVPG